MAGDVNQHSVNKFFLLQYALYKYMVQKKSTDRKIEIKDSKELLLLKIIGFSLCISINYLFD